MPLKKTILITVLSILMIAGMFSSTVEAVDELQVNVEEQNALETHLPEVLTGMDENGNIYELDTASGYVEETNLRARSGGTMVVNFNTKGFSETTSYYEVGTNYSGYVCGAYGADAAYLGTYGTKVRFMLSGVIGEVEAEEVQVIDISAAKSLSHYIISDGRLYHKISTNLTSTSYGSTLVQGAAPSYLKSGVKYYSYDGHYFYNENSYDLMLIDYANGTRANSVNPNSPYYNYYQYLPLRSQTSYSGTELNDIINGKVASTSKMYGIGATLVNMQETYGVNALLTAGVAANESGWGKSSIALNKNNLFGLNAVDSSPGESANYYADVATCIKDFTETYMSKQYLNPNNWKYFGGFLGNKASGINVKYASDPYWGEKAANVAWALDKVNGYEDVDSYTIGIKDLLSSEHTSLNVRKESSASSTKLYNTGSQSMHAFLILGEENGFYKIQSDPVLTSGRTAIDNTSGVYNFSQMYAYSSSSYITKVISGNTTQNKWVINGIDVATASPQLILADIGISANMSNAGSDLQYKFVWMKNSWSSWGVIQDFSSNGSAVWTPEEAGEYTIYMDVKDSSGRKETVTISYTIKSWGISGITTNLASPQAKNTSIKITPQIVGSTTGLQYKFVWMKNSWSSWAVISEMSSKSTATWTPNEAGEYTLFVDIKDSDGYKITKSITYTITEEMWSLDGITCSKSGQIEAGETVTFSAKVSNSNDNLQYKFVWMKDNWSSWGVIQDFSSENLASWTPETAGTYKIYVDVKDLSGNKATVNSQYTVSKRTLSFTGIELDQTSPQEIGISITITPEITGNTSGLEYKYVWMKNNWSSWAVIQDFSEKASCVWTPEEAGEYRLYVDIREKGASVLASKWVSFEVNWGTWNVAGLDFDLSSPQIANTPIEIAARIVGNKTGLEYKFVWMKDNWKSWGVIQAQSEKSKATWTPTETGEYKIYIDVFDKSGKSTTYIQTYSIEDWIIVTKPLQQGTVQEEVTISLDGISHNKNLLYKFVWMKDNWKSWGVIQEFSESQLATWVPEESGEYYLYVDVKNKSTNKTESKRIYYKVK